MKKITKKLICIGSAFLGLNFSMDAQTQYLPYVTENEGSLPARPVTDNIAKTESLTLPDTLWYFLNKHYYRNASPLNFSFNNFLSAPPTSTGITHCGSIFLNSGTLTVTGLEGVVTRQNSSPSASVPLRLYLCNVNSSNLPVLPAIDSISTSITGFGFATGNFATARTVTANFAVLIRNVSAVSGDTIKLSMTNALTPTSTSTSQNVKYGEGLGVVRSAGSFISTTNAFGAGTDFEFLVAPRVNYTAVAALNSPTTTVCTGTAYTYSNTSTPMLGHRQYNLNQFYRVWKPFGNTSATTSIKPDSVFSWNFGNNTANIYTNAPTLTKTYTVTGVHTPSLTVKFQKMSGYLNISSNQVPNKLTDISTLTITAKNCNTISTVGIINYDETENVDLYPNPTLNGQTLIKGLHENSSVFLYDLMGQLLFTQSPGKSSSTLDLSAYPAGNYYIKVTSPGNETRVMKLVHQN